MKTFNQFLLQEENRIFYRGINEKFNSDSHDSQHITWVTPNIDHAKVYGGNIIKFKFRPRKLFNFGFRRIQTHVTMENMLDRIQTRLFTRGEYNISEKKMRKVYELIKDTKKKFKNSGFKYIWEWYDTAPVLITILKALGHDAIEATEGSKSEIETYGVINKSILIRLRN